VPTVDLSSWREEFPVLDRKAYLISASLGPVSRRSRRYLDGYLDAWAAKGAPDNVWFEDIFPTMRALKQRFAALAGCDSGELAITTNVSIALSTIASCVDFTKRRKVIMSELDFPTDGHVWLAQRPRGAEVVFLKSPDGLTIPLEEYERAVDEDTAVVMVNRVLYRSSALVDAKEVCRMARRAGAWSFVDDYHGIGIVPLDLRDLGCDFYTAGVLKWLCGGPGLAFLYARRDMLPVLEPAVTGWFATREPFSFDNQHLEYHPGARRLSVVLVVGHQEAHLDPALPGVHEKLDALTGGELPLGVLPLDALAPATQPELGAKLLKLGGQRGQSASRHGHERAAGRTPRFLRPPRVPRTTRGRAISLSNVRPAKR